LTGSFTHSRWLLCACLTLVIAAVWIGTLDARSTQIADAETAADHEKSNGQNAISPEAARDAFVSFLETRKLDLSDLSLRDGIAAMLDFYRDVRATGLDLSKQDDMLLFQWGTYDWGRGEHFEVDITRQLIFKDSPGDDARIWQLSLTFAFEPSPELLALGDRNKWCDLPGDLPDFTAFVLTSPAVVMATHRQAVRVTLRYERAD